jgi:hypothetical protein
VEGKGVLLDLFSALPVVDVNTFPNITVSESKSVTPELLIFLGLLGLQMLAS